jgi:cephalosporin-C deacetylase-like acetyl esterase
MIRLCTLLTLLAIFSPLVGEEKVPTTVAALWADVDPTAEPLEIKVVREWQEEGLVLRYVTYHVGTFKGKPARVAAFYAFPRGARKLPGLVHLHGGGQRAFLHEVKYYAQRGYACLSINWGGREMEDARAGDANTDWGAVDPTQKNVPGYANLKPGPLYLDPVESPRNNNWYLLTLASRRALTFLEQQAEVDAERLGVYGHSMGGNLTVYVAGTDRRVKASAPSVGGQGFRTVPWTLLPEQRRKQIKGDLQLYRATLGFQSYAPHVQAPLLWLSATNDFHQVMDDTFRTGKLIPHENLRYSFAPHLNHRFTPPFAVTRPLWFDQHLKGSFTFPKTPQAKLVFAGKDGLARLEVRPDMSAAVDRVHILYSIDPHPMARFWRTAPAARQTGDVWMAPLPVLSTDQPLFAFANVHYKLAKPVTVQFAPPTETYALSSQLQTAVPRELQQQKVLATDKLSNLIDDFSRGFQDWYLLSADNPHHWQYWTRKITDPKWQGQAGEQLTFDVKTEKANQLVVIIKENFFRGYRGRQRELVTVVELPGGDQWQKVSLPAARFQLPDGEDKLSNWEQADLLGFRPYYGDRQGKVIGSTRWAGPQPQLRNLRWSKPGAGD